MPDDIGVILAPNQDVNKPALIEYLRAQEAGVGLDTATPVDADSIKFGDASDSGAAKGTTIGALWTLFLGSARTFTAKLKVTIGVMVEQQLTDGATISWDASLGQVAHVTLAGNRTLAAPTNLPGSSTEAADLRIVVIQDGTGSRSLVWNAVFKFAGGSAPTLTSTAAKRDTFTFKSDGTNLYEVGRKLNV